MLRRFNVKPSDLGAALGTVTLLIGVLTPLLSGFVIDRIARARIAGGNLLLLSAAALLEGLAAFAAFAPSPVAAVCFLSLIAVCAPLITTTVYATCQQLVPGAMRGLGMALIALFGSIIGGAGGPFMISWVTETVFRDDGMVGVSISIVIVPCVTIAAAMFFATWRRARRESARGAS